MPPIVDLSRIRAQRLARAILGRQALVDRLPIAQRLERERMLDGAFDEMLRAAERARATDALTAAIARACLARAVWRAANDLGADPDTTADAYTVALFELASAVHGESERPQRARRR